MITRAFRRFSPQRGRQPTVSGARPRQVVIGQVTSALLGAFTLPASADVPTLLLDVIFTPDFNHAVNFTNDAPWSCGGEEQPGDDLDFVFTSDAEAVAGALDNASPGDASAVLDFSERLDALGFRAPLNFNPGAVNISFCHFGNNLFLAGCPHGLAYPGGIDLNATRVCGNNALQNRDLLAHELMHLVQFNYVATGSFSPFDWFGWGINPFEGTASIVADHLDEDLDADLNGDFYLRGDAGSFISTGTDDNFWEQSYTSALGWKYAAERYGTDLTEPVSGFDFVRRFWENAEARNGGANTLAVFEQTLQETEPNDGIEDWFLDFAITNRARELDTSGFAASEVYTYQDENDGTGAVLTTNSVPKNFFTSLDVATGGSESLEPWAARYHQVSFDNSYCDLGYVFGARLEATTADFGVLLTEGSGDNARLLRVDKGTGSPFVRVYPQRLAPSDDRRGLNIVAASNETPGIFSFTYACEAPKLAIRIPSQAQPAFVGPDTSPGRFIVRLRLSGPDSLGGPNVSGLTATDFSVTVGGEQAGVISGEEVNDEYWLAVQAPPRPGAPVTYDLDVTYGVVTETVRQAVDYSDPVLDQVIVLDRSGSMKLPSADAKLTPAVNAASVIAYGASDGDQIGLVTFAGNDTEPDEDATLPVPLGIVTDTYRDGIAQALDGTLAQGFTSIGDGLFRALVEIDGRGRDNGEDWAILLTDGSENEARLWSEIRSDVINSGVRIAAIAFGADADQALLQEMSATTDGSYYYVDAPDPTPAGTGLLDFFIAPATAAPPFSLPTLDLYDAFGVALERTRGFERVYESRLGLGAAGSQQINITVPAPGYGEAVLTFAAADTRARLDLRLTDPNGQEIDTGIGGAVVNRLNDRIIVRFRGMGAGDWRLGLSSDIATDAIVMLSANVLDAAELRLRLGGARIDQGFIDAGGTYLLGNAQPILAGLYAGRAPLLGQQVIARVEHPDAGVDEFELHDDGRHGDGAADDGLYGYLYTRTTVGDSPGIADVPGAGKRSSYRVTVVATGRDLKNRPYQRIARSAFQVYDASNIKVDLDIDKDGLPDPYEGQHSCLVVGVDDSRIDFDEDTLDAIDEWLAGTLPCDADTDDGGETDGSEVAVGGNPLSPRDDAIEPVSNPSVITALPADLPSNSTIQPNDSSVLLQFGVGAGTKNVSILRSDSPNGPFTRIGLVDSTTNFFRDTAPITGKGYYRIQSDDGRGRFSPLSRIVETVTQAGLPIPVGTLQIASGGPVTSETLLSIALTASDDTVEMRLSNDPSFSGVNWEPFSRVAKVPLPTGVAPGERVTIYGQMRDTEGNRSLLLSDGVTWYPASSLGTIAGTVLLEGATDYSGIEVVISDGATLATAVLTNSKGDFDIPRLLPGSYTVTAYKDGYGTLASDSITVKAGATTARSLASLTLPLTSPVTPIPLPRWALLLLLTCLLWRAVASHLKTPRMPRQIR